MGIIASCEKTERLFSSRELWNNPKWESIERILIKGTYIGTNRETIRRNKRIGRENLIESISKGRDPFLATFFNALRVDNHDACHPGHLPASPFYFSSLSLSLDRNKAATVVLLRRYNAAVSPSDICHFNVTSLLTRAREREGGRGKLILKRSEKYEEARMLARTCIESEEITGEEIFLSLLSFSSNVKAFPSLRTHTYTQRSSLRRVV